MRSGLRFGSAQLRFICRASWLILVLPVSAVLAQESLCDPCVDPPLERQFLPPPPAEGSGFNLGASISNLRALTFPTVPRTLVLIDSRRMSEEGVDATDAVAIESERGPDDSAPEAEDPDPSDK
jgi:hypothetical protein